ncbi:MAG: Crp/Fnr family transcriptional regulator, partial [Candidatus Accumulibacter meliphilus]
MPGTSVGKLPPSLLALYPSLRSLPAEQLAALGQQMAQRDLPAGTQLFSERQDCMGFPLLLAGTIKVVKSTAGGREMLLYRVEPGGSCIISSSCLLGHTPYSARGIAETPLSLLLLPIASFEKLLAEHASFRNFVFHLFAE